MAARPPARQSQAPEWTELNSLSCASLGSTVLFSTDDWFAAAENLLNPEDAVWREGFTEQGKWMDGWESRRKRVPGHDWCLVRLGLPGLVHGVTLDTSYFTGNYAPRASVQAANLATEPDIPGRTGERGRAATCEQLEAAERLSSGAWETIVERTELDAGYEDTCRSFFTVQGSRGPFTHIRLNIFPDGGVARCRVFGVAVARPLASRPALASVDLCSVTEGGLCLGYSDAHYGHPRNIIKPGPGVNMGDGWETARRLDRPAVLKADSQGILAVPGHEWAVFRLGRPGAVTIVEVDTNHFKGNYPDSVLVEWTELEAAYPEDKAVLTGGGRESGWRPLLPQSKLGPHQQHRFTRLAEHARVTHIRVKMYPDGGISRIRVIGNPTF